MTMQDSTYKSIVNVPNNVQIAALPQHENTTQVTFMSTYAHWSQTNIRWHCLHDSTFAALLETLRRCVFLYIPLFLILNITVLPLFYFFFLQD